MSFSIAAMIGGAAASKGMELANTVGTSYLGSLINYSFGKKAEKVSLRRQYKYAEKYAKNSPSWTVEGLRNANLNPILAATDGAFSSPTVPSVSTPSFSGGGSSGDSILDGLNTLSNLQTADKQRDLMSAQAALTKADAELAEARIDTEQAHQAKLLSDAEKARVDSDNARHTKGVNNIWSAGMSALTHLGDVLPANTSTSSKLHDIKSSHVPTFDDVKKESLKNASKNLREVLEESRKRKYEQLHIHGSRRGRGPKRK